MVYSLVLLNKPVINSDKNEKMGQIKGYVIEPDEKRVTAFILAPAEGQSSLDVVPYSYVKSVYSNAVITENLSSPLKLSDVPELLNTFLKDIAVAGAQVITDTGMLMGTVHDFAISEKDGVIERLSLIPDKDVEKVAGRHIMKITQERIIVNADALTEKIDDDDAVEAPAPPRPAQQPAPATSPVEQPTQATPTATTTSQPEVAAMPESSSMQATHHAPETIPAPLMPRIELPEVPTTDDIKGAVRELFEEMSGAMLERISDFAPAQSLESFKEEILDALRAQNEKTVDEDELDQEARAMEMLLEEKITIGATAPIDNVKESLANIESMLSKLIEKTDELAATGQEAPQIDTAPIKEIAESLGRKLDETVDAVKQKLEEERPDPEKLAAELAAPVIEVVKNFEDKAITTEEFKKQLLDFSNRNEERTKAINSMVTSELDRIAGALGAADGASQLLDSDTAAIMFDDLAGKIISGLKDEALGGVSKNIIGEIRSLASKMDEENEGAVDAVVDTLSEAFQTQNKTMEELKNAVESNSGKELAGLMAGLMENMKTYALELGSKLDNMAKNAEKRHNKLAQDIDDQQTIIENSIRNLLESRIAHRMELEAQHAAELNEKIKKIESIISDISESVLKKEDLAPVRQWIDEFALGAEEKDAGKPDIEELLDKVKTEIIDAVGVASETGLKEENLSVIRQWLAEYAPAQPVEDENSVKVSHIENLRNELADMIAAIGGDNNTGADALAEIRQILGEVRQSLENTDSKNTVTEQLLGEAKQEIIGRLEMYLDNFIRKDDLESIRNRIDELMEKTATGAPTPAGVGIEHLESLKNDLLAQFAEFGEGALRKQDLEVIRGWLDKTTLYSATQSDMEDKETAGIIVEKISAFHEDLKSMTELMLKSEDIEKIQQEIMGYIAPEESADDAQPAGPSSAQGDAVDAETLEKLKAELIEAVRDATAASAKSEDIDGLRELMQNFAEKLPDGNSADTENITESLVDEINTVVDVLNTLTLDNREQLKTLDEKLTGKVEKLKQSVEEAISKIAAGTGSAAPGEATAVITEEQIGALREELAAAVTETVGDLLESAAVTEEVSLPGVAEIARMIDESIAGALQKSGGATTADLENIKTELLSKIDDAAGRLETKTEALTGGLRERLEESVSGYSDMAAGIREFLSQGAQFAGAASSDDITQLSDRISSQLDDLGRGINSTTGEKLDSMKIFTQENADRLMSEIESKLSETAPADDDATKEIISGLPGRLDEVRDRIIDEVGAKANDVTQNNADKINELRNSIEEMIGAAGGDPEETLRQLRQVIAEKSAELHDSLSDDIDRKMSEKLSDQAWAIKRSNENIEKTLKQLRESVRESLDAGLNELASMKDMDRLRERIEARVGDVIDNYVERIEDHLDRRDIEMEKGFKAILKNMEKLLSKGFRTDLESMFAGGGILSSLFGGQRPENPLKIASRSTARGSGVGPTRSQLEDTHIKRLAYLIGKRLKKDVADSEGNILAAEGEVVNEAMIRRLRDKQCTLQLIRNVDFSG